MKPIVSEDQPEPDGNAKGFVEWIIKVQRMETLEDPSETAFLGNPKEDRDRSGFAPCLWTI
jgi:hypothetical protein